MAKRDVFSELMEGVAAMKGHRAGKITLRSYKVEAAPLPEVDSKLIRDTRKRLGCSRAVFARRLRINERTLEKWEQGAPSQIHRRRLWCCWCAAIRTRWRGWMRSRLGRFQDDGGCGIPPSKTEGSPLWLPKVSTWIQ